MGKGTYRYRRRRPPSRRPEALFFLGLIALAIFGCVGWYVLSQPEPVTDSQVVMTNEAPASGRQADVSRQSEPAGGVAAAPVVTQQIAAGDPSLVKPASVGPARPADTVAPMNQPVSVSEASNINGDKWLDNSTARHANCPLPADIQTGSFQIQTKMPTLPAVQCDYRIPIGDDGRPLPTAADMVLLFPYPTEKAAIFGIAKVLTEKHGFTTVSIRFPGMGPQDGIDGGDHTKWYYWPESGSGDAWMEAIKRVRRIGNFPDRKVFVTGLSGGGSAAGLFADSKSELVDAVADMAGRVFSTKFNFRGPILLMYGAHDYVVNPILSYVDKANSSNVALTTIPYPPMWSERGKSDLWQHQFRDAAQSFFYEWISAIADLRIANHGIIPRVSEWPLFESGVYFPSLTSKKFYDSITPASNILHIGDSCLALARVAAGKETAGRIVILSNDFTDDFSELILDAEFFADHGWLTVAMESNGRPDLSMAKSLMDKATDRAIGDSWILITDAVGELRHQIVLGHSGLRGVVSYGGNPFPDVAILTETGFEKTPFLVLNREVSPRGLNLTVSMQNRVVVKSALSHNISNAHAQRCSEALNEIQKWIVRK